MSPRTSGNLWKAPFGPPEEWDLCVAEHTIEGPHGRWLLQATERADHLGAVLAADENVAGTPTLAPLEEDGDVPAPFEAGLADDA
jgi:hypothetical protein